MEAEIEIGPDYLEVVSFIGAAVVTHGSIRIEKAGLQYLDMIRLVLGRLGVEWQCGRRRLDCSSRTTAGD